MKLPQKFWDVFFGLPLALFSLIMLAALATFFVLVIQAVMAYPIIAIPIVAIPWLIFGTIYFEKRLRE